MKIADLIATLQKLEATYGNVDVHVPDPGEDGELCLVNSVTPNIKGPRDILIEIENPESIQAWRDGLENNKQLLKEWQNETGSRRHYLVEQTIATAEGVLKAAETFQKSDVFVSIQ